MSNFDFKRKWFIIDASDLVLGRMSTEVATILMGKNKPFYTPNIDYGDNVIVINAKNIAVTGNKEKDKFYYSHSRFPGGLRTRNLADLRRTNASEIIYKSIWGMIPHNKLGRKMIKKLFIYNDSEHGHEAQQPEVLIFNK